jgi:hypothetical protein
MKKSILLAGTAVLGAFTGLVACCGVRTDSVGSKASFLNGSWPGGVPAGFCIDFSDAPVGGAHSPGSVIHSNGREVLVTGWGAGGGAASVQPQASAGGATPELWTGSCLVEPQVATAGNGQTRFVELALGEFGGSHALKVNGAYLGLPTGAYHTLASPGVRQIGNVIYEFTPGGANPRAGHVRFRGFIETLSLGGQELAVDDICGWPDDCGPVRSDLIDSPFSTTFPASGTISLAGTRGIAAQLLGTLHRVVVRLELGELHVPEGASLDLTASVYAAATGQLLGEGTVPVTGAAAPQSASVPLQVTLAPGEHYVFAFHVLPPPGPAANVGYVNMGGWPYHESEAVFLVEGARNASGAGFPQSSTNDFPRISVHTICR